MQHSNDRLAICLDLNRVFYLFVSGIGIRWAKNADWAERKLDFRNLGSDKKSVPSAHVAEFLKAKGGVLRSSILVIIVVVGSFEEGATRTFWIFVKNEAVSYVNIPLGGVKVVQLSERIVPD